MLRNKDYFKSVAVIIGYIIGVGMFGLPYVVARSGVAAFLFYIFIFTFIQYLIHLLYANLIVITDSFHRLAGYAGIYLGRAWQHVAFSAKTIGNLGALLAYYIISGIFLHELLSPILGGGEFAYTTAIFAFSAIVVFFGLKAIANVELVMSTMLLLVVCLIFYKGSGVVDMSNFSLLDPRFLFLPYGVMLMALDGNGAMPIVAKLLKRDTRAVKSAVRLGTFMSAAIILFFTLIVVGISGPATTPDALVGMKLVLNNGIILFSLVFGVLTMTTSILLVSEAVKETLMWDYNVNKTIAWAIPAFAPYIMFLAGARNLTSVISLTGGVAGGLAAIILMLILGRLRRQTDKLPLIRYRPSAGLIYALITMFVLGMIYEVHYFFT